MNGVFVTILVFAGLIALVWQTSNLVAYFLGIPFIRTPRYAIKDILELADIKSGERFFELGSGWGEILSYVSKKYNIKAYGIEASPVHYFFSAIAHYGNKKVKIRWADFSDFTLTKANVVYCSVTQKLLKKMENKFVNELTPGTRLLVNNGQLSGYEPKFTYQAGKNKINFYQF